MTDHASDFVKYDGPTRYLEDAELPEGVPRQAVFTKMGMFVAWTILRGFASNGLLATEAIAQLHARSIAPGVKLRRARRASRALMSCPNCTRS